MYWAALLALDVIVYGFIGLLMMNYDDHWDASQGEYGSWASMRPVDQAILAGFYVWNAVNLIVLFYVIRKIFRARSQKHQRSINLQQ